MSAGSRPREERLRPLVAAVVRQALADRALAGIVLIDPPGPEGRLLLRWMEAEGVEAVSPDDAEAERVRERLPGRSAREAWRAVGRAWAEARGLLPASTMHKTGLLLGGEAPPERLLPLGDLYGSEVRALAGGATLPGVLSPWGEGAMEEVDRALRDHLEAGVPWEEASRSLDPALRESVGTVLARRSRGWMRPPIIPKLSERTLGVDLE